MIIDFSEINEETLENFKGGNGIMFSKGFTDGVNNVKLNRLQPGASGGYHLHSGNCEMMYVLSGEIEFVENGCVEICKAGQMHYCPKGHQHSFTNKGDVEAVFVAVIPKQ